MFLNRFDVNNRDVENAESRQGAKQTPVRENQPCTVDENVPHSSMTESGGSDSVDNSSSLESKGKAVESKLLSIWHNMKYGFKGKIRANFSKEQPVWLLGVCYHQKYTPTSSMENSMELNTNLEPKATTDDEQEIGTDVIDIETTWMNDGIEGFKRDFVSRLWMTYRREFPTMTDSSYTSDCGWGCMLRSGQMMLAQALVCHFLGRSWRYDAETQLYSTHEDAMHRKIIRWFGDSSSRNCPFSIHTLVKLGTDSGKKPGDWYGPGAVSYLMRQAVKLASQEIADLDGLNVYVAQDSTVYLLDIFDECLIPESSPTRAVPWQQQTPKSSIDAANKQQKKMNWKSLVLLIPLRLGVSKMNPAYENSLKALLSTEYCIGIIGGRPKHSLYFVGYQEDKLIHLDPHYCQDMVDVNQENFLVSSFHCKSPRKLKLSKMDPSCCIGFYCRTRNDFDDLISTVQPYLFPIAPQPQPTNRLNSVLSSPPPNDSINYPMFMFCRGRILEQSVYREHNSIARGVSPNPNQQRHADSDDDDDETEEFIII